MVLLLFLLCRRWLLRLLLWRHSAHLLLQEPRLLATATAAMWLPPAPPASSAARESWWLPPRGCALTTSSAARHTHRHPRPAPRTSPRHPPGTSRARARASQRHRRGREKRGCRPASSQHPLRSSPARRISRMSSRTSRPFSIASMGCGRSQRRWNDIGNRRQARPPADGKFCVGNAPPPRGRCRTSPQSSPSPCWRRPSPMGR